MFRQNILQWLFFFYILCTSERFSENVCRPIPLIHNPSVCFECYTCLLMPFYKRALSYLLVLSMSLRVNRFDKNKQALALFNIFNGGCVGGEAEEKKIYNSNATI